MDVIFLSFIVLFTLKDHVSARKSPSRVASPRQSRGALVLEEMARELLRSPASQGKTNVTVFLYTLVVYFFTKKISL